MSIDRQTIICGATTRRGTRCKSAPVPGSNPPRCTWHRRSARSTTGRVRCKGRTRQRRACLKHALPGHDHCFFHLPPAQRRRLRAAGRLCTAHTVKGKPCSHPARKGSRPPRCDNHSHVTSAKNRCQARTIRGRPCNGWPTKHSIEQGRPLCAAHSGLCHAPETSQDATRPVDKRRCQARKKDGKRCRNWALTQSRRRFGRPLCRLHALPQNPGRGHRCQATLPSGSRCQSWALRRSKQRYGRWFCRFHAPDKLSTGHQHGFYSMKLDLNPQEQDAIRRAAESEQPLAAELLLMRLKLLRLVKYLAQDDLPAWRRYAATRLTFRGASAVKRLLFARHNLARVPWTSLSGGKLDLQLARLLKEEEE